MSTRSNGHALAVAALALVLLLAWMQWDRPRERSAELAADVPLPTLDLCPSDGAQVASETFRLGGQVVRAHRWCDVDHVIVDVSGDLDDDEHIVVVVASSIASATLTLTLSVTETASLPIGPDGWLAVAIVQASEDALARGGAWFSVNAGAPLH